MSCGKGHGEVVEKLLGAGADVSTSGGDDASAPVLISAEGGHEDLVSRLLDAGVRWQTIGARMARSRLDVADVSLASDGLLSRASQTLGRDYSLIK